MNNAQEAGWLTVESGLERFGFAVVAGRIQAVVSTTSNPEELSPLLPPELADLALLLSVTLGERQDAPMSGLVRLLERSLTDPRRLRSLLRFQAAVLTHHAITAEPGKFTFEPRATLPPMFQAFPLQMSLPALLIEGVRFCETVDDPAARSSLVFARQSPRGGNLDRAGMSAIEMKIHALLDGTQDLASIAKCAVLPLADVASVARGLELAGQVERRLTTTNASILVLEEDHETARVIQHVLGAEGDGYELRLVKDRVGAQLLLRRNKFNVVMMSVDQGDEEHFYNDCREKWSSTTRFIGIAKLLEDVDVKRLDAMNLDGILHRPISEGDLRATVKHVLAANQRAAS